MSSSSSSGSSGGGGGGGTGGGSGRNGNQGGCFVCGAKNHKAGNRCPMVSLVPVPCSRCGKTGHTSVDCTEPAAVASMGGVATGTPSSPGFSPTGRPANSTQQFQMPSLAAPIGVPVGFTPPYTNSDASTPNGEAVQKNDKMTGPKKRSRKTRQQRQRRKSRKSRKLNNRRR
jgi:hypothetical protein